MQNKVSFYIYVGKNSSIVITKIKIPAYVILGQTVHLYCLFELRNGTDLYTLKWFKDGAEFYRSVPRASVRKNRRLIFPMPGVKVDFENSKVFPTNICCRRRKPRLVKDAVLLRQHLERKLFFVKREKSYCNQSIKMMISMKLPIPDHF